MDEDASFRLGCNLSIDPTEKKFLRNAYIMVYFFNGLKLKTGRFKPDFGCDFQNSESALLFIERSYAPDFLKEQMRDNRLYGMELQGKLPYGFEYALGSLAEKQKINNRKSTLQLSYRLKEKL